MQKFRFLTNSHLRVRVIQYDCVVLASYVDVVKWEVVLFADLGHLASGLVARSAAELSFSLTLAFLPPSLPLSLYWCLSIFYLPSSFANARTVGKCRLVQSIRRMYK